VARAHRRLSRENEDTPPMQPVTAEALRAYELSPQPLTATPPAARTLLDIFHTTVALCDTMTITAGRSVGGRSVVMRGEQLPAGTRWHGAPVVAA
jgi:hypothetical protein